MASEVKKAERSGAAGKRTGDERALFDAFAHLTSGKEAARFLRDLATPGELGAFAERWRIARLLDEGKLSYREIASATGASTTTVGRVARFLREENHQGYRLVLDRMAEKSGAKR